MGQGKSKLTTLQEAVERLVKPGSMVALGCALEGFIPFAAAHEIIRQKKGPLTLAGPISDICFDQLIGAGLVEKVVAAWVGNVTTGVGYNFRRAVETGLPRPLAVVNHSNFSLALALEAGARGLPMAVSRSPAGSDIVRDNPDFLPFSCPHGGQRLLAVKALKPDLAILHVQRADRQGNCQVWGATGVSKLAAQAASRVLITCEELVDTEVIRSDPDRTLAPGILVDAVCHAPHGAHPSPVQGHYGHDAAWCQEYALASKSAEGMGQWLTEWVFGVAGREEYLAKVGEERLRGLAVKQSRVSPGVEYGW